MTATANAFSHSSLAGAVLASGYSSLIPGAVQLPPFMPTSPAPHISPDEPFSQPRRPQIKPPVPTRRPLPYPAPLRFSSRDQLIESNLHLVESLVSQLYAKYGTLLRGLERDDLVQEGRIGLIQAADSFDESKNTRFETHAYRCISSALCNCLRTNGRQVGLFEQVLGEVEDYSTPSDETKGCDLRSDLRQALTTLDERTREAITLHVVDEHSKAEVARRLGMTRQGASELIERGLTALRRYMAPTYDQA